MTQSKEPTSTADWKEAALSLVTTAIKNSGAPLLQMVHDKIDATTHAIITRVTTVALFLLGGTFLAIAAALWLGDALGAPAYGFGIVGAVVVCLGVFIRFAQR